MVNIVDCYRDVNDSKIFLKNLRNSRNVMVMCTYLDPFLSTISWTLEGKENIGCDVGGNGEVGGKGSVDN